MGPHMQERIKDLEKEIREIKQRNLRVEADKAWEVSWTRIFFISISTYIIGEFLSKKCALSPRLPYVILILIATVLIGVFLFKEKLSMLGITGIILVFISIVLLLMN
ncbi:hypothetical protein A2643_01075 [Candidatus Nomurabacteria bacterium RIFCSPHIGHO2_01_FULL_39_220]|uniref:EamA domain-containing protein n=1 Tax=Candidatus Nomurabacteria bacterium RIFCSPLOWO2_02_FULL_40_67 TaxID=1801787 RepID=A0A1F6Y6H0_9BACT|nr:MAG: hypothetical protein UU01_C0027G0007 [Parcubacteria group bacterium GW2011_GWA2_40_37]OGI63273.1 MAG: hypothetical protein A2W12_02055 [Candidatus Nomurabacteria bacterium RBG_16_40_11]OGI70434.1 MAG: hypothetical protein A2643_01075 [Candidatus Nomurabacteria bacterium RIFCSPHIGHO2_01_FULL_39_220]OGI73612.1 MAG: hypothetical protein A2W56_01620 [Candidatus Nomurabacteria bacterium RIFCSPHIGHO2_02_41_18]OGI78833.1 MAG: hypothetical protein A3C65_01185 [Candidatus Nomurabacteria bacteriu